MLYRKSVELSFNFIVILIISIVLFGFGIKFISNLSSQAIDIQDMAFSELDGQIRSLICEGNERVCIGRDRKTINKGDFGVFGLNVVNVADSHDFVITVSPPEDPYPIGFRKDKTPITNPPSPQLITNPAAPRSLQIGKNEERSLGIGVQVPPNAVSGTYILNINILNNGKPYSVNLKLYVDVP